MIRWKILAAAVSTALVDSLIFSVGGKVVSRPYELISSRALGFLHRQTKNDVLMYAIY